MSSTETLKQSIWFLETHKKYRSLWYNFPWNNFTLIWRKTIRMKKNWNRVFTSCGPRISSRSGVGRWRRTAIGSPRIIAIVMLMMVLAGGVGRRWEPRIAVHRLERRHWRCERVRRVVQAARTAVTLAPRVVATANIHKLKSKFFIFTNHIYTNNFFIKIVIFKHIKKVL